MNRHQRRANGYKASVVLPREHHEVKRVYTAPPEMADAYRAALDKARQAGGEATGEKDALDRGLAMLLGVFAHLVDNYGIEKADKMIRGSVQSMVGQALIKRAQDIKEGKRPPMTKEEFGR